MKKVFAFLSLFLSIFSLVAQEADYSNLCKWDSSRGARTNTDRIVQYFMVSGAFTPEGEVIPPQEVPVVGRGVIRTYTTYFDKTGHIVRVSQGNALSVVPTIHSLQWMHFYLYIDYNHDGMFDQETELVSYTHFRATDPGDFYDSKGQRIPTGNIHNGGRLPEFTIPIDAKLGQTRARFKCDWNSKDPCGDAKLAENRGAICDFTIEILAPATPPPPPAPEGVSFTINVEGNGTAKVFDVINNSELTDLNNIDPDQILELRPVAAEGHELVELKINDIDMMSYLENGKLTLDTDEDKTIMVKFAPKESEATSYTFTYTWNSEGGEVTAAREDGTEVMSGSKHPGHGVILLKVKAKEGYELTSITEASFPELNVKDLLTAREPNVYEIESTPENITINVVFTKVAKPNAVEDIAALGIGVRAHNGAVLVTGAEGLLIDLYTTSGQRIAQSATTAHEVKIPVEKGVYLVKVGSHTTKVLVD